MYSAVMEKHVNLAANQQTVSTLCLEKMTLMLHTIT